MKKNHMKTKSMILAVVSLSILSSVTSAESACEAILNHGIRDIMKSSDVYTQWEVAHTTHCHCYVPPFFRPTGLKYPAVRQGLIRNIPC